MEYQVWTKDEYQELWTKVDCGDLEAAKREVDTAVRSGREPLLTAVIPYTLSIKVEEDKIGEVTKSKAKPGKDPRGKSDEQVQPGGAADLPPVGETSGDSSADHPVSG